MTMLNRVGLAVLLAITISILRVIAESSTEMPAPGECIIVAAIGMALLIVPERIKDGRQL